MGPVCSTLPVMETSKPAMFRLTFTLFPPADEILRPEPPAPSAEDTLENGITPVPVTWLMVPLWKPGLSRTSVASAAKLNLTGPAGTSLAVMWTSLKRRAATWVRNGNPLMVTSGLAGNPWLCICLAAWFSA